MVAGTDGVEIETKVGVIAAVVSVKVTLAVGEDVIVLSCLQEVLVKSSRKASKKKPLDIIPISLYLNISVLSHL